MNKVRETCEALNKFAVLMAVLASGVTVVGAAHADPSFVSIGTASPAGAYYPLGVSMAEIWNKAIPSVHFNATQTGGSIANLNELKTNSIQVGFANANIVWKALEGKPPFSGHTPVQGGWVLNKSYGVFVVTKGSGITKVSQLRGKVISLGAAGSSANVDAKRILKSQGLGGHYHAVYLGWQESANALSDGSISAAFMVGGEPLPAISSLAVRTPVRILIFNKQKLAAQSGFPLEVKTTPKGIYGTKARGDQIVIPSLVLINPKMPNSMVYQMVKAAFAHKATLIAANASGKGMSLISPAQAKRLGLPIAPGVARFEKQMRGK